jgi:hypothetical protein
MEPRKRVGNAENYLDPHEGGPWPDWLSELRRLRDRRPIVTPITVARAETLYRVKEGASAADALSDAEGALAPGRRGPGLASFGSTSVEVASARQKMVVL